jgi:putative ABC transport system permease protein
MADGDLFRIFRVPFVRGRAETALRDAHSVALSESEAKRRFGEADPMGKDADHRR